MKIARKLVLIIFMLVLLLPVPLSMTMYSSDNSDEKREKAEFPTTFSDTYGTQLEAWFKDNSPFREKIIKWYSNIDVKWEMFYTNWLTPMFYDAEDPIYDYEFTLDDGIGNNPPLIEDYDTVLPYPYLDNKESVYPPRLQSSVIYGRDNWLFFKGEKSLSFYTGENAKVNDEMLSYYQEISEVDSMLKERGIELRILILPNKEQVYADKMPTYDIVHNAKMVQRLRYYLKSMGYNNFYYPIEALIGGRIDGRQTYLQQDTHWNEYGAMIGALVLMKSLGAQPLKYTVTEYERKGGDLASMLGSEGDEYVTNGIEFKPDINVELVHDSHESRVTKYESTAVNNKKCVIFGDSYREAITPLLAKEFHNTSVYHYTRSSFAQEDVLGLKAGDCIFIIHVERYIENAMNSLRTIKDFLA